MPISHKHLNKLIFFENDHMLNCVIKVVEFNL